MLVVLLVLVPVLVLVLVAPLSAETFTSNSWRATTCSPFSANRIYIGSTMLVALLVLVLVLVLVLLLVV